ncbi:MAG: AAA family ATPase, partial [Candidatus Binatia bacterium]
MFRFLELRLHGWDLWREAHVPLDGDVVLVSGPNGSGKTTLIDAIRQLLNAPRLSSRRRLQHYLRNPSGPALIRAVVSNVDGVAGGSPPFRRERITSPEVTLACALVPGGGGTPEKRFAILPGRPSLADLRQILLESRDFYPPERYGRALENAGVTRSLMSVLALEQGKTNTLFELRPAELFRKVLEMLGDQAILERYREARRRYEDTERELFRQTSALQGHQAELTRVQREVRRRSEWEEARDKVADLEARLPAAELQRLLGESREAGSKSRELQTKVQRGEAERTALTARLDAARSAEAEARAVLEKSRTGEERAKVAWEAAVGAGREAAVILRQLEERQRELEGMPAGGLAALLRDDEEAARALFTAEMDEKSASLRATSAAEKVERLASGLPDHPEAVTKTLAALESLGIPAALLPALIEAIEPRLAESAEGALGDARWALLVTAEDENQALEVAREHGFPGPVYAGPRLLTSETAGPLALLPGAPAWLPALLESVGLSEDGSWSDARGRWVA